MTRVLCDKNVLLASLIQAVFQENSRVIWATVEYRRINSYRKPIQNTITFKGVAHIEFPDMLIYFNVTLTDDKLLLNIERTEDINSTCLYNNHVIENLNTGEKIIIAKNEDIIKYRKIYPEESHEIPLTSYKYVAEATSLARNIVELILKECD